MTPQVNCLNFEERINKRLDLRLSPAGDMDLVAHSTTCAECRMMLQDYQLLDRCLNLTHDSNCHAVTSGYRVLNTDSSIARLSAIYSIAAVLLIGVCLAFGILDDDSTTSRPVIAASSFPPAINPAVIEESPDAPVAPKTGRNPEGLTAVNSLVYWNQISEHLSPLNPYYQISAELPGVRPFQYSLGITIDWFQNLFRFSQDEISDPGFGVIIYDQPSRFV